MPGRLALIASFASPERLVLPLLLMPGPRAVTRAPAIPRPLLPVTRTLSVERLPTTSARGATRMLEHWTGGVSGPLTSVVVVAVLFPWFGSGSLPTTVVVLVAVPVVVAAATTVIVTVAP